MEAMVNPEVYVTDILDVEYKLALDSVRLEQFGHALFHVPC